jgi:hypothetical protein
MQFTAVQALYGLISQFSAFRLTIVYVFMLRT